MSGEIPHSDEQGGAGESEGTERRDAMAPPKVPCECYCLHCGRTFMSDQMWLQRVIGDRNGFEGFWMCPTNNCSGAGFTFDIFPTDPDHPGNEGWCYDDGEEGLEEDEASEDWDPSESKYKELDEEEGDDDDLEGEEWKHGLQPGERGEPEWVAEARRRQEEEQRQYNEPDRRPREVDWTNREDRINEDDIPF
jgi:hypothetical protein